MKYILLILFTIFLTGCSEKIEVEPNVVVKDNYIFINKCDLFLEESLLKIDKIKIIEGNNEEEVKQFIIDLYILNKENETKIKTISTLYNKYTECLNKKD